ncbi:hypothetical protein L5515_019437 [Caenorhabditis briggsae]|uniref:Uncharacterized protein n=1 Tax=Caenorhabditis briggsae TaxID=6238 RepID=A0AAE9JVF5_CAEBR|nr:hypothetical protein L5515_019437 [Caenorhabditis briggsae]
MISTIYIIRSSNQRRRISSDVIKSFDDQKGLKHYWRHLISKNRKRRDYEFKPIGRQNQNVTSAMIYARITVRRFSLWSLFWITRRIEFILDNKKN